MDKIEIKNAKIRSTMLGVEDHGIMTCMLHVEGDGWGQGFGGYSFDSWDEKLKKRVGSSYGIEFIKNILETLEVGKWEQLPGTYVRIENDFGKIYAIGHITKDKWFRPSELK